MSIPVLVPENNTEIGQLFAGKKLRQKQNILVWMNMSGARNQKIKKNVHSWIEIK